MAEQSASLCNFTLLRNVNRVAAVVFFCYLYVIPVVSSAATGMAISTSVMSMSAQHKNENGIANTSDNTQSLRIPSFSQQQQQDTRQEDAMSQQPLPLRIWRFLRRCAILLSAISPPSC